MLNKVQRGAYDLILSDARFIYTLATMLQIPAHLTTHSAKN